MFDTVNFWINRGSALEENPFDVLPYLNDVTERNSEQSGYSCSGQIGDYKMNIFQNGISLKGSLAKHCLPSNIYTLTRQSTEQAIEQLSDSLHIDMSEAKVTRLDISTVIPTQRPPTDYYNSLGDKPRFERVQATKNTLYYNTQKKQLIFYDKTKEAHAKGVKIPPTLIDCNLLRYELRFTKELQRQLKAGDYLKAKQLYDSGFYYSIIQQWKQEFEQIKKINQNSIIMQTIKTPKEAQSALFSALLQQGGQSIINGFISDLKANKTFTDAKYYSRLKADLNKILQVPQQAKSELIKELETAIKNIAKYAR